MKTKEKQEQQLKILIRNNIFYRENNFYYREARLFLKLGAPLGVANVAAFLIVATDTIMVSKLGQSEMLSVSLGFVLYSLVVQFIIGCCYAIGPTLSRYLAMGKNSRIPAVVRQAMILQGLVLVLVIPLFFCSKSILGLLGQDALLSSMASQYLKVMYFSLLPACVFQVFSEVCAAYGKSTPISRTVIYGLFANVLLNFIFIFGGDINFGLGIVGSAIASVLSLILMVFLLYVQCQAILRDIVFQTLRLEKKGGPVN